MLFGRLRVPVERAYAPEPRNWEESGIHIVAPMTAPASRGEESHAHQDAPARPVSTRLTSLTLVRQVSNDDEFAGLDRLDREELDQE